jgi:exosortase A-associated hydrolase 1
MAVPASESVRERFVTFTCRGETCVGVLSTPIAGGSVQRGRPRIGVLIVVGGPQYRAGSHRQFVSAARAYAEKGFPTMRFDVRGMGDSDGDTRSFEDIGEDIVAAAAALRVEAGVEHCVLWGLCDAATAAIIVAPTDRSIAGVVALNPWARTTVTQASALVRHHYASRLLSLSFWRRVLAGKVALPAALKDALRALVVSRSAGDATVGADFLARMHASWAGFGRPLLVILSGGDQTAREFEAWVDAAAERRALLHGTLCTVERIADADHTFSLRAWQGRVDSATIAWLHKLDHASLPIQS